MANKLWEFTMKVTPAGGEAFPNGASEALVPTYAGAPDHETALRRGVNAIVARQIRFRDLEGSVREIPLAAWSSYIAKLWPDFAEQMPTEHELPGVVDQGAVFFGPFLSYKA